MNAGARESAIKGSEGESCFVCEERCARCQGHSSGPVE